MSDIFNEVNNLPIIEVLTTLGVEVQKKGANYFIKRTD